MSTLVCDIGGTNTRLGIVVDHRLQDDSLASYANDDFADFPTLLQTYVGRRGTPAIGSVCIALAAVAAPEGARLTNRDWDIERSRVAEVCNAADVQFINDFEALGFSLVRVERLETQELFPDDGAGRPGPRLVLGAGTGFNAAACFPPRIGAIPHVAAAECGHMTLPLEGEEEFSLQASLSQGRGRASVERALSGNGLVEIYAWCCARNGREARFGKASEVATQAVAETDADARQAADVFLRLLGRVTGDLALAFLPSAGIFLSGGVTRALAPLIVSTPSFHCAFRAKGRQSAFMESFPISLLLDDRAALSGCAEWMRLLGLPGRSRGDAELHRQGNAVANFDR